MAGFYAATQVHGGVLAPEIRDDIDVFRRIAEPEAKAAFAKQYLGRCSRGLESTWKTVYLMLDAVRERRLWEPEFASFEEYFVATVGKPVATWVELESTYRFVESARPDLWQASFAKAASAMKRSRAAALATTVEDVLPPYVHADVSTNLVLKNRSERNGISRPQQQKIDKLAREAPELLREVREGRMSVNAAFIAAGFAAGAFSISRDPEKAAATIRRQYTPEQIAILVECLTGQGP